MQDQDHQNFISVSVAMCTYNGAEFLAEQLDSLLAQTYPLKEIIIFDDASSDGTVAILQNYAAKHPLIHLYLNEQNVGFTRNFEQAMLATTGDAIAICDQDDVWMLNKIEKMVTAWKPEMPLIYCYSMMFQHQLPVNPVPSPLVNKFQGTDARRLCLYNTVSGHTIIFKRYLLQWVIPFSENTTYDWWMAVVAACNGGVQYFPEVLVCQRYHTNNVTLNDHKFSKIEVKRRQKLEIVEHNEMFATAPNISTEHKAFFLKLALLAQESLDHPFYKPLFLFLFRNRRLIFYHKKRKISLFSHLKHSYRRTITK